MEQREQPTARPLPSPRFVPALPARPLPSPRFIPEEYAEVVQGASSQTSVGSPCGLHIPQLAPRVLHIPQSPRLVPEECIGLNSTTKEFVLIDAAHTGAKTVVSCEQVASSSINRDRSSPSTLSKMIYSPTTATEEKESHPHGNFWSYFVLAIFGIAHSYTSPIECKGTIIPVLQSSHRSTKPNSVEKRKLEPDGRTSAVGHLSADQSSPDESGELHTQQIDTGSGTDRAELVNHVSGSKSLGKIDISSLRLPLNVSGESATCSSDSPAVFSDGKQPVRRFLFPQNHSTIETYVTEFPRKTNHFDHQDHSQARIFATSSNLSADEKLIQPTIDQSQVGNSLSGTSDTEDGHEGLKHDEFISGRLSCTNKVSRDIETTIARHNLSIYFPQPHDNKTLSRFRGIESNNSESNERKANSVRHPQEPTDVDPKDGSERHAEVPSSESRISEGAKMQRTNGKGRQSNTRVAHAESSFLADGDGLVMRDFDARSMQEVINSLTVSSILMVPRCVVFP